MAVSTARHPHRHCFRLALFRHSPLLDSLFGVATLCLAGSFDTAECLTCTSFGTATSSFGISSIAIDAAPIIDADAAPAPCAAGRASAGAAPTGAALSAAHAGDTDRHDGPSTALAPPPPRPPLNPPIAPSLDWDPKTAASLAAASLAAASHSTATSPAPLAPRPRHATPRGPDMTITALPPPPASSGAAAAAGMVVVMAAMPPQAGGTPGGTPGGVHATPPPAASEEAAEDAGVPLDAALAGAPLLAPSVETLATALFGNGCVHGGMQRAAGPLASPPVAAAAKGAYKGVVVACASPPPPALAPGHASESAGEPDANVCIPPTAGELMLDCPRLPWVALALPLPCELPSPLPSPCLPATSLPSLQFHSASLPLLHSQRRHRR